MIIVGAVASVINSIGQTLIHSGLVEFGQLANLLAIYAIGDLFGLIVCMVMLMFYLISPSYIL